MNWEQHVKAAECLLSSPQVPSSLEIISLIKKVNPTRLPLSESKRERGYQIKNRLQNLLLEQYGEAFYLVPHAASSNIILIKHRALPSIDACHAELSALSKEALESVEAAPPLQLATERPKPARERLPRDTAADLSPQEVLKKAQALLEEYDYPAAEEVLAGLEARSRADLQVLARAASILLHEIGAYQCCIDTLLRQPNALLKDRGLRELLAVAYHRNGSLAEARALLDNLYPVDLGLDALCAYADIAFKDGNISAAWGLVNIARGKEGFCSELVSLQKDIEQALSAQAGPVVQKALAAFESGDVEQARRLAGEALDLDPHCQEAHALIVSIEARNDEARRVELWARLEKEPAGGERIVLLNTLLELDKDRSDTIRKLIADEKVQQRRMLFDARLDSLRELILKQCWSEAFDAVTFLMRQPEFPERAEEIVSLCPYFSVLYGNKRLNSTSDRSAKDLWLRFVKAKLALAAGRDEACLETFDELRPWFGSAPEFQADHLMLQQREQTRARAEIAALLEQTRAPECSETELRQIHSIVRKRMAVLSIEERRELASTMEEHLDALHREQDVDKLLRELRDALQIGNREKAACLRREITDLPALKALDAEFAQAFHIGFEPISLEMVDDLPVDLTTPPPLGLCYASGETVVLEDGDEAYVLIDFAGGTACRIESPVFAKAWPADHTNEETYLFVEEKDDDRVGDMMWRAEITAKGAAFTACIDMRESFNLEAGCYVENIKLSSEKDTDYYVLIQDEAREVPARLVRKSLAPKKTVLTQQIGNCTDLKLQRWSSPPDRFLVKSEGGLRHLNRNLSTKAILEQALDVYQVDEPNCQVYTLEGGWRLTQRDLDLGFVQGFEKAHCFGMFEPGRVHGISIQTDTALIVLGDGQQSFYNLRTNKFSSKVRVGRVIPSRRDGKWYCFDYSRNEGKLRLRDISRDIHTKLHWKELFRLRNRGKGELKGMLWFNEPDNFVYRPSQWEPGGEAARW
ncbi:hypothetical protein [Geomesophilobacter sediminis]|uniref:Tetratricopeptide repeat protein n=1 Tax=Geomesophilobacter sediminis TaxID=2798584 RepID=A0A8J7JM77_9BACT|nr:hypothetical protein [Geomesophilobacter sediminis]MBJ6725585.1 hypothetical protein [Geomesophilobacter sediminis]